MGRVGLLDQLAESRRVLHRNLGKNLAVEFDSRLLQPADQP